MNATDALASLRSQVAEHGQAVAIRRYATVNGARVPTDTPTRAFVRNYGSSELTGMIVQGDQKAITLIDGLAAILPVLTSDWLVVGGKEFAIKNPAKRVVAGVLIGLDIQAKG